MNTYYDNQMSKFDFQSFIRKFLKPLKNYIHEYYSGYEYLLESLMWSYEDVIPDYERSYFNIKVDVSNLGRCKEAQKLYDIVWESKGKIKYGCVCGMFRHITNLLLLELLNYGKAWGVDKPVEERYIRMNMANEPTWSNYCAELIARF